MPLLMPAPGTRPPLTPMGMDKGGDQLLAKGAWTYLTGWAARSGFAGTVIDANSLVVDQDGAVAVTARTSWTGNGSSGARGFRVLVDGAVAYTVTSTLDGPQDDTRLLAVVKGQRLTLQGYSNRSLNSNQTVAGGAASTFLYFTTT